MALGEIGLDFKVPVEKELQYLVFQDLLESGLEEEKAGYHPLPSGP